MQVNKTYHGDFLDIMPKHIEDKSIDMIFTDLPYGTTKCKWDIVVPLHDFIEGDKGKTLNYDEFLIQSYLVGKDLYWAKTYWEENYKKGMWSEYNRVIKDNGVILLYAQTPFDKVLGNSNLGMLRYEWIWEKTQATGHLNAKKMPMKAHENILVFYKKPPTYNAIKTTGHNPMNSYTKYIETQNNTEIYGKMSTEMSGGGDTERYLRSVQVFASDKQKTNLYSTQKPLALTKYMIETYTNEGDIVLDTTSGSGTTGLGASELNREYIMIEKDRSAYELSCNRVKEEIN